MRHWNDGLRLTLPAILVASAAGCATDDGGTETGGDTEPATTGPSSTSDDSSSTSASATETGGSTTATADSGTDDATTSVDTGADSTSDTGELPDCGAEPDETACVLVEGCEWRAKLAECIVDCTTIHDEATCMEQLYCFWLDDGCVFGVV